MLGNEFGDLDLFKLTEEDDDDVIEEDGEDSFEMMGEVEGDNNGWFGYGGGGRFNRRGGEVKIADVGFFNSFEDDFDDQDLL
uniref:Uncharacterized protein n=1 Tax=Tanacetum cinerariifolium TaxID=118510 RepID=A0A6L2M3Z1_TANCI|nr:hypothetical protein [Tanacetum cinerariifolium]